MAARRVLARIAVVGAAALVASILLVGFFAWLALNVSWAIPEPDDLAGPSTVRARDGTVLTRFDAEVDRRPVALDRVSEQAKDAIVASEDARFYEHEGVDVLALLRAVATNVRTGAITQGGSTLTQQYVKKAFTDESRTFVRKVREAVIAVQMERQHPKDEILERYLNTVYFGEGAYGIEAAAQTYFGRPAARLNAEQAATLAQLLPAPSVLNPRESPERALARRDRLLHRMGQLGMLASAEVAAAVDAPLDVRERRRHLMEWPYFTSHVRRVVAATYGDEALYRGGLDIVTTLDLDAQRRLVSAVEQRLPPEESNVEAAAAVVHPATGDLVAVYGGRDFYADTSRYSTTDYAQYNLATQGARQPGSTFKPFVVTAALEEDIGLDTRFAAPATITLGDWTVRNADRSGYGTLTLEEATVRSVNTVFAQLGLEVGAEHIVDVASRMGIRASLEAQSSIAIGGTTRGPSVLDMASAFATYANDGMACPARSVLEVRRPDGQPLPAPDERRPPDELLEDWMSSASGDDEADGRCYQSVDRDVSRMVTGVLEQVVGRGTGSRADIDRPQAGKTGTTNDFNDAWFAGYTPDLSLVVWLGDPDERRPLENVGGFSRMYGGTLPALMWRDAARLLLEDIEPRDFPEPGEEVAGGRRPGPAMGGAGPAGGPTAGPTGSPSPQATGEGQSPEAPDDGQASPSPSPTPSPSDSETEEDDDGPCLPPLCDDP